MKEMVSTMTEKAAYPAFGRVVVIVGVVLALLTGCVVPLMEPQGRYYKGSPRTPVGAYMSAVTVGGLRQDAVIYSVSFTPLDRSPEFVLVLRGGRKVRSTDISPGLLRQHAKFTRTIQSGPFSGSDVYSDGLITFTVLPEGAIYLTVGANPYCDPVDPMVFETVDGRKTYGFPMLYGDFLELFGPPDETSSVFMFTRAPCALEHRRSR